MSSDITQLFNCANAASTAFNRGLRGMVKRWRPGFLIVSGMSMFNLRPFVHPCIIKYRNYRSPSTSLLFSVLHSLRHPQMFSHQLLQCIFHKLILLPAHECNKCYIRSLGGTATLGDSPTLHIPPLLKETLDPLSSINTGFLNRT